MPNYSIPDAHLDVERAYGKLTHYLKKSKIDRLESAPLYCMFALGMDFFPACLESFREQCRGKLQPSGISEISKLSREPSIPASRDRTRQ